MSFIKSMVTVGGWTSVSRVVGFIRDVLIAHFLGASMMADSFFVALRFPNLFRSFFAEGTLNVAFVPLFSEIYHTKGKKKALEFSHQVAGFLFYILLFFTILIELFMPLVVYLLAPGFDEITGKIALTTTLTRITFPFLFCISIVSLLSGILNALGRFWLPAFVPIILNLTMILSLYLLTPFLPSPFAPAYALSIGVFIAGVLELFLLLRYTQKLGFSFSFISPLKALFKISKEVKTLLKKMVPGIFGSGIYQINLFLDTFFVSFVGAGAISWLNYANHIFQLPIGVIGVALSTTLLPILSKHIKKGELKEANFHLNRGLEISLSLSLASMIGLIFLSYPIVSSLFERGRFTALDSLHTSRTLVIFSLGLPAYMITKTISPFFYAHGDTKTPVKIAVFGLILNAFLALLLMGTLKYIGIALATTIAIWVNALQYIYRLLHKTEFSLDISFKQRIKGICLSCISLIFFLFLFTNLFDLENLNMFFSTLVLFFLILSSCLVFTGTLFLTKVITLKEVSSFFRRKK